MVTTQTNLLPCIDYFPVLSAKKNMTADIFHFAAQSVAASLWRACERRISSPSCDWLGDQDSG